MEVVSQLIEKGSVRYTSITNENLELLERYHESFDDKLISHEVCYNLEVKENEKEGIIPYALENDILTITYQPIRRNRTAKREWPVLVKLANKYNATQNQILLAWHISKGFLPLTKSETINHIDEHIQSLEIKLEDEDINELNDFSPSGYKPPVVDWNKSGVGVSIDQLSNVFDDEYDKQLSENKSN